LLVWYAFWFVSCSLVHSFISSLVLLPPNLWFRKLPKPWQSSILLSSLSFYFFQYVKERFVSLQLPVRSLQFFNCLLLTAFC